MSDNSERDADRRLDARDVEGEPFGAIMDALDELERGGQLLLVNSFEPEPLYGVLEERGFEAESEQVASDEWHVLVEHAE